ncbi:MAG: hypothetical protein JW712_00200 [Dehalococcoidales bacterium]|nr:hypothetical protein [Dehalococcoidales bacterium]
MDANENHLPETSFHEKLVSVNGLDTAGFSEWLFLPSMVFGAEEKWWGDKGKRDSVHEGVDILWYRDACGAVKTLAAGTKIPAIFPGKVERVIRDFLGVSVFVSHDYRADGYCLFTVYGHTQPVPGITVGRMLAEGDIIGIVADPAERKLTVLAHLHVSVVWVPESLPVAEYDWDTFSNREKVILIDPLEVLHLPYSVASSLM